MKTRGPAGETRAFTPDDDRFIAECLRQIADIYIANGKTMRATNQLRLAEQFERQAEQARIFADRIQGGRA